LPVLFNDKSSPLLFIWYMWFKEFVSMAMPSILQQLIVAIVSLEKRTFSILDTPFDNAEIIMAR
jgi:hypothetical protein